MTSRRAEDVHDAKLKAIVDAAELVCLRVPEPSTIEEEEELLEEETFEEMVEETTTVTEDQPVAPPVSEEEKPEELPTIFPSPSLRRVIPDRLRKIEALNRIRVLPKTFRTDIDPEKIPKIRSTPPQIYIDILAEITGCNPYKSNMAEFWFLDTLANLLRRAQEDKLDKPTQAVLILWFCEWMKEIENFDAASRERMLRRWKENMLKAAEVIGERGYIPAPAEAKVYYEAPPSAPSPTVPQSKKTSPRSEAKPVDHNLETSSSHAHASYDCSLADLAKIIHYIYDLFSTDYQYNLVRMIFTFGPDYHLIHGTYQLETPKKPYAPLKPKGKPSMKSERSRSKLKLTSSKVSSVENQEFIRLMELQKKEQEELEELEDIAQEEYNKKHSILPLGLAVSEDHLELYFPISKPESNAFHELEGKGSAGKASTGKASAKGKDKKNSAK